VASGLRAERQQLQALLDDARRLVEQGRRVRVVVAAHDRLGRRLYESARTGRELASLGVPVHSVREGGDLPDLVKHVLASLAQEEARLIGARVAASRRHFADAGWHLGRAPWGYLLEPATDDEVTAGAPARVLRPNPVVAPYIKEAYGRLTAGQNLLAVCRWLSAVPELSGTGHSLRPDSLKRLLRFPVYVARGIAGDENVLRRPKGRWPALVEDHAWAAAQARLGGRAAGRTDTPYLLVGVLRCGACGDRAVQYGRGRYYICRRVCAARNGRCDPPPCGNTIGRAPVLERAVLQHAQAVVERVALFSARAFSDAWRAQRRGDPGVGARERALGRDIRRARRRLQKASRLRAVGALDEMGFQLVLECASGDLAAGEQALRALRAARLDGALPKVRAARHLVRTWRAQLRSAEAARRKIALVGLLTSCAVHGLGPGQGPVTVAPQWTPVGAALAAIAAPGGEELPSAWERAA
jgi:hypothetical protein